MSKLKAQPLLLAPGEVADSDTGSGLINLPGLLDSLENLRWFIVKSFAAILIGMVLCLVAGNAVVDILRWPLRAAPADLTDPNVLWLQWASDHFKRLPMPTNQVGQALLPSASGNALRLTTVPMGGREVLGFRQFIPAPGTVRGLEAVRLNNYGPTGAFVVAFQITAYGGFFLASPFVFYFLAQLFKPLFRQHASLRDVLGRWTFSAIGLFLVGVLFCYFVLLRVSLYGSVGFANWMNLVADEWSAEDYIGFVCKFMLAMGLGFELPVVILLLVRIGILSREKLVRMRVYWVVLNLVLSAIITPDGSPLTMLLMAAPLMVLYELSIIIARRWEQAPTSENAEESRPGAGG